MMTSRVMGRGTDARSTPAVVRAASYAARSSSSLGIPAVGPGTQASASSAARRIVTGPQPPIQMGGATAGTGSMRPWTL